MRTASSCVAALLLCLTISYATSGSPYRGGISYQASLLRNKYGEAIDAIFGIGIRSTALLADPSSTGNVIVSPVSITVLIGQLMLGAEGVFRDQLYNLLTLTKNPNSTRHALNVSHFPYARIHQQLSGLLKALSNAGNVQRNFTLRGSNALFYDQKIVLDRNFANNLKLAYDTYLQQLDFDHDPQKALDVMNKWAETQTNGLIKTLLPSLPSQPHAAIFANALYFLGEWETPFSQELNRDGPFFVKKDQTVNVTYMIGFLEEVKYAETPQYKMLCLPYRNRELSMYILLPNEDNAFMHDIRVFQQTLQETEILSNIRKAKFHQVTVKLPKMSLSSKISILKPLQKYVAYKAHTNKQIMANDTLTATNQLANLVQDYIKFNTTQINDVHLTAAAVNAELQVSDIVQQLTLSVNEKGTEAAAITAGIIDYIGGSKNFLVERPFVFFIQHEETSVVLFWGAITNPVESNAS